VKLLIIFPHALGDMILLTPALKAWCEKNDPPSIAIQRRFNSCPLDNCPYINHVYYGLSDPWQDFGNHNTQFGFPATQFEGIAIANRNNYSDVIMAHEEGKIINYAQMLGVDIKDYKPEVFISHKNKMDAYEVIYNSVNNEPYGFSQTYSGDPDRSFPTTYTHDWLKKHKNLNKSIEAENLKHLSVNAAFEIMKEADGVILPNSVFWQAAGALNKTVDLAYFSRGVEDLNRRKYEIHYEQQHPFYDEKFYQNVVFNLETLI